MGCMWRFCRHGPPKLFVHFEWDVCSWINIFWKLKEAFCWGCPIYFPTRSGQQLGPLKKRPSKKKDTFVWSMEKVRIVILILSLSLFVAKWNLVLKIYIRYAKFLRLIQYSICRMEVCWILDWRFQKIKLSDFRTQATAAFQTLLQSAPSKRE